jgi:predicted MFS family arabinose efflux permease
VDAGIRTLGQVARLAGAVGGGILATAVGTRPALVLAAVLYSGAALLVLATMPSTRR